MLLGLATTFGIGEGADGSINRPDQTSGYQRKDISFSEYNYDLMLNYNKDLTTKLNLKGVDLQNIKEENIDDKIIL